MGFEEQAGQWIAGHWYLILAAIYLYRWFETEKRARSEAERLRREDERAAREEARETIRTVVREELTSIAELVRQHETRIAVLEKGKE